MERRMTPFLERWFRPRTRTITPTTGRDDERSLLVGKSPQRQRSLLLEGDIEENQQQQQQSVVEVDEGKWGGAVPGRQRRTSQRVTLAEEETPPTMFVYRMPAILVGAVLNLMLAYAFGLAFFPQSWDPFPVDRALGVSMFLFTTAIAQLVMALSSGFEFVMGMCMVENLPFMHAIATLATTKMGSGEDAVATTITAWAVGTVACGVAFWVLGRFKCGNVVNFIPVFAISGCVGGIGVFVVRTGLEVTTGVEFKSMTQNDRPLVLASIFLVAGLRVAQKFLDLLRRNIDDKVLSLFAPCYFLTIIPAFYLVLCLAGGTVDQARHDRWLFPLEKRNTSPFTQWTILKENRLRYDVILQTLPITVASTIFALMHAPINLPSLAASTRTPQYDMNRELRVHGVSNLLAACLGGVPNYLCYSNSVLVYKCGGGGKGANLTVFFLTVLAMLYGVDVVAFVPRCLAGSLLVHLGVDLVLEAVLAYDRLDIFEYVSVLSIGLCMTLYGMTEGLALALVASCATFTLQLARFSEPVRRAMHATTLRSTKPRSLADYHLLQTRLLPTVLIIQLQGILFFANATALKDRIATALMSSSSSDDDPRTTPEILVLDFTLCKSIDSSAADVIANIYAVVKQAQAGLCFAVGGTTGFPCAAPLSDRLRHISDESPSKSHLALHIAEDLDAALRWCEDVLLDDFAILRQDDDDKAPTPRKKRSPLVDMLRELLPDEPDVDRLAAYLRERRLAKDERLWTQFTPATSCALLTQGLLESSLEDEAGTVETVAPGSFLGEYAFLGRISHTTTVRATADSVLYELDTTAYDRLKNNEPTLALLLFKIALGDLGTRCNHVSNRIIETKCVPI